MITRLIIFNKKNILLQTAGLSVMQTQNNITLISIATGLPLNVPLAKENENTSKELVLTILHLQYRNQNNCLMQHSQNKFTAIAGTTGQ